MHTISTDNTTTATDIATSTTDVTVVTASLCITVAAFTNITVINDTASTATTVIYTT